MDSINFQGGFFIGKPSSRVWNNIKAELPKHKCVFENFNENGDKFFAVKSCADSDMVGMILRKKVNFRFYPDINLKSRLDSYNPKQAQEIINSQTTIYETKEQLRQFLKDLPQKTVKLIKKYHWKPNDHIDKTFEALGLNQNEYKTQIKSGITYIKDKSGKVIAKVSPNNERGVNFVYVYPRNYDEASKRFALSQSGETENFGPLQIIEFQNNFMKNVRIDLGRKRPQK